MWAEAGKAIAKFSEGVVTALDTRGYPVSVRLLSLPYDASNGELPVSFPDALDVALGPANLLCHSHDDKLWNMKMISVKGRVERRDGRWVFATTAYQPESQLAMIKRIRKSAQAYLDKRGLPAPVVDFAAVTKLWARAKLVKDP